MFDLEPEQKSFAKCKILNVSSVSSSYLIMMLVPYLSQAYLDGCPFGLTVQRIFISLIGVKLRARNAENNH